DSVTDRGSGSGSGTGGLVAAACWTAAFCPTAEVCGTRAGTVVGCVAGTTFGCTSGAGALSLVAAGTPSAGVPSRIGGTAPGLTTGGQNGEPGVRAGGGPGGGANGRMVLGLACIFTT